MTDKIPAPGATIIDAVSQVPAAARDFVRRTASAAKERAVSVHTGAENVATALQDVANVSINSSAAVGRSLLKSTCRNVEATLGMVQDLAGAKDLGDAVSTQLDFIRDYGKANVEQFRAAAEIARKGFEEAGEAARGALAKPGADTPAS